MITNAMRRKEFQGHYRTAVRLYETLKAKEPDMGGKEYQQIAYQLDDRFWQCFDVVISRLQASVEELEILMGVRVRDE